MAKNFTAFPLLSIMEPAKNQLLLSVAVYLHTNEAWGSREPPSRLSDRVSSSMRKQKQQQPLPGSNSFPP